MKTAEQALVESILDGLASEDISVIEKAAHVAEQVDSYRDHVAATGPKIEKGIPMTKHDELIRAIAKNVVDRATPAVFDKSAYVKAIERRVAEVHGVTPADGDRVYPSAFTRTIVEDEIGQTLFKAMRFAKGPEVDPPQDEAAEAPVSRGKAHDEMQALADRHHRANPHLSAARAYANVYADKANAELKNRVIGEHLSPKMRTPPGHAVQVAPSRSANHATMVRTS